MTVIYLDALLPLRSSHPGSGRASLYAPIPVLLRIEFTASRCSHVMGELLPRLSTLTSSSLASYPLLRRKRQSTVVTLFLFAPQKLRFCRGPISGDSRRYISVALALESPPPDVIRHSALRSSDFPHLRSFDACSRDYPTDLRSLSYHIHFQM